VHGGAVVCRGVAWGGGGGLEVAEEIVGVGGGVVRGVYEFVVVYCAAG